MPVESAICGLSSVKMWLGKLGNPVETMGKVWENDGFMGFYGIYPLTMTNIAILWENDGEIVI